MDAAAAYAVLRVAAASAGTDSVLHSVVEERALEEHKGSGVFGVFGMAGAPEPDMAAWVVAGRQADRQVAGLVELSVAAESGVQVDRQAVGWAAVEPELEILAAEQQLFAAVLLRVLTMRATIGVELLLSRQAS